MPIRACSRGRRSKGNVQPFAVSPTQNETIVRGRRQCSGSASSCQSSAFQGTANVLLIQLPAAQTEQCQQSCQSQVGLSANPFPVRISNAEPAIVLRVPRKLHSDLHPGDSSYSLTGFQSFVAQQAPSQPSCQSSCTQSCAQNSGCGTNSSCQLVRHPVRKKTSGLF